MCIRNLADESVKLMTWCLVSTGCLDVTGYCEGKRRLSIFDGRVAVCS